MGVNKFYAIEMWREFLMSFLTHFTENLKL